MTVKSAIEDAQSKLDNKWIQDNPYGQFIVTKDTLSHPPYLKGTPVKELQAWWITGRSTSQRVSWMAYAGKLEKWPTGHLHEPCPSWPQNYKKYRNWEKFKKDYPELALQLQQNNPDCGRLLKEKVRKEIL